MKCNVWSEPSNILPQLQFPRCVELFPFDDSYVEYPVISVVGEITNGAGAHVWLFTISDLVSPSVSVLYVPRTRLCDPAIDSRDQIVKGKLSNKSINYAGPLSSL